MVARDADLRITFGCDHPVQEAVVGAERACAEGRQIVRLASTGLHSLARLVEGRAVLDLEPRPASIFGVVDAAQWKVALVLGLEGRNGNSQRLSDGGLQLLA